jgi:hypothetical protein
VSSVNAYVARDLAELRFAFPQDADFAAATNAVAREVARALAAPLTWGIALGHGLTGWRRSAFASAPGITADLRLIFRPRDAGGIDVLMFGLRYHPDATSIYHTAATRR